MSNDSLTPDPWSGLRQHTAARIGLGRRGAGLPTHEVLEFQLAHARARDAVHAELDEATLLGSIEALHPALLLHSRAANRAEYLLRPDLGRRLAEDSHAVLTATPATPVDLTIVVTDGLSAPAVMNHAPAFLAAFLPLAGSYSLGPVALVRFGRVAVGDEVGALLRARAVVVLIGERPGLGAHDSMGIYLTWQPAVGLTDERRNCISNVRPAGLPVEAAAEKLAWLLNEATRRKLTGVELKDESGSTRLA